MANNDSTDRLKSTYSDNSDNQSKFHPDTLGKELIVMFLFIMNVHYIPPISDIT